MQGRPLAGVWYEAYGAGDRGSGIGATAAEAVRALHRSIAHPHCPTCAREDRYGWD